MQTVKYKRKCEICGKFYLVNNALRRYCPDCSPVYKQPSRMKK
jgi:hypothetical protein